MSEWGNMVWQSFDFGEGYSRNVLCALNLITSFYLIYTQIVVSVSYHYKHPAQFVSLVQNRHHWNVKCSHHDLAETLFTWRKALGLFIIFVYILGSVDVPKNTTKLPKSTPKHH